MILNDFFSTYYWPLKTSTLRECTLAGYESAWRLHIQPYFGTWEMADITAREIERWFLTFSTTGAARKSWSVLRPILRMAVRYDFLDIDPSLKVFNIPKREKYIPPTLTKQEVYNMIEAFKGSPLEVWVLIAATTGLRKEESAALLWSDVNLDTGAISITKGAQWIKGKEIVNPPKTRLSYRTVYLPEFVRKRLKQLDSVFHYKPDARIIGKIHAGQITPRFKSECAKRGVTYVPPKCLRHTWATIALAEGVPISIVSRCLGHYDVSTTARYYIAPHDNELIYASEVYNQMFKELQYPTIYSSKRENEASLLLDKIKALF